MHGLHSKRGEVIMNATARRLLAAYTFFRENAGGIVGESAATAWALARAEETGRERGLTFVTEDEEEPWDGDCEAPTYVLWCAVFLPFRRSRGGCLASLGMVGVNSMRDPYLRVVAAELMSEALAVLDAEDQATADTYAARATLAGV